MKIIHHTPPKTPKGESLRLLENTNPTTGSVDADVRIYLIKQMTLLNRANNLFNHNAVLEDQKGRDAADAILYRNVRVGIDVHFGNFQFTIKFAGEFFNNGGDHFAGAAPNSPKINQNRGLGIKNFALKRGVRYIYRFHSLPFVEKNLHIVTRKYTKFPHNSKKQGSPPLYQ